MSMTIGHQDVSRETYDQLEYFSELVIKWTTKINLISPSTIDSIWDRHIVDSAQLFSFRKVNHRKWVDLGSGGGFPGVISAILGRANDPDLVFVLIESDQRKATFLRTAIRELSLNATVIADRIEEVAEQEADIVSARALTSLSAMMPYLYRHLSSNGSAILHKGKRHQQEVAEARQTWSFDLEEFPSLTDPVGRILSIQGIARVA